MKEKITRKEFLVRGTNAALAVAGITACGKWLLKDAVAAGKIESVTVGADKLVTRVADLKERAAVNFIYNEKKYILLYNNGEIRAFKNICTHQGGPTKLAGAELVCQWHGAHFNPLTGEATKSPAPKGSKLPPVKLDIKDGKIYLAE